MAMHKHTKRVLGDLDSQGVRKERLFDIDIGIKPVWTDSPDVPNILAIMRTVGGALSVVEDSLNLFVQALDPYQGQTKMEAFVNDHAGFRSMSKGVRSIWKL